MALKQVADFLLPAGCAGCSGPIEESEASLPVCRNCRLGVRPVPTPVCERCGTPLGSGAAPSCLECSGWPTRLVWVRAASVLVPPASRLVHALKYQGWRRVGHYMGREMARTAPKRVAAAEVVVPVPTSPRTLRRRGYNQARVIAEALADALGVPLCDALGRHESTATQTTLSPIHRASNVRDAFHLSECHRKQLEGRSALLVDDVITTGATLAAAARALEPGAPAAILAYAFSRRVPLQH